MTMKKLWFRARDYGWGWYPASWQGWAVLGVWFVFFVGIMSRLEEQSSPAWFMVSVFASVVVLLAICWKTGERPYWQWAGKPISAWRGVAYSFAIIGIAAVIAAAAAFIASR